MNRPHKILVYIFLLSFIFCLDAYGQKWTSIDEKDITENRSDLTREIIPENYKTFNLNLKSFRNLLELSPDRFKNDESISNTIHIPLPDGSLVDYKMTRSDVFHPDLAAKYPLIQSYTGTKRDDPSSIIKLSISHKGINAMILSDKHPTVYIDRYAKETEDTYIVYYKKDFSKHLHDGEGHCSVETPEDNYESINNNQAKYGDCQLRKYRLALACTGEYATFHGGNIPDVLAEYNVSMTRVNGIYEREFAITMELIANTDELIYLDGTTDPYTNNEGGTMLTENQNTIDDVIGFTNYDIGHVFSTGGGGIASLRSPCTTRKARGVTGLGNPTGDPFWVDYVAHEMGHQFGGNHTQNNDCNRNQSTAMEPGSASTIMGYAGICSPNVQNNSDDYFHSISIEEVANFVVAGNGDCAETITIDNSAPELEPLFGNGLVLPISTPFELFAIASDADNDGLTYCWEQQDNESADMPPESDNTGGPAFRSFDPSNSPSRYFPAKPTILIGNTENTWEVLPSVNRDMNFNITVRDNNSTGGCTANDDLAISFTDQAGPFMITSQNESTTWNAGTQESITWSVANTDQAPVSCSEVDIYLSIDGGDNFDILLLEGTANDGEEIIDVPFQFSQNCRLLIKCSSSIFLDINDEDFSIVAPFSAIIQPEILLSCPDQTATYQIDYTEFDDEIVVTFDISGLPDGASASFSDNPVTSDGIFDLSITDLQNVSPGIYLLNVSASSPDLILNQNVTLIVSTDSSPTLVTTYPTDAETNVSTFPTLTWEDSPSIVQYEVEVSDNPSFDNIVATQITNQPATSGLSLNVQTVYYWRVRALSPCFDSEWGSTQSFQTKGLVCNSQTEMANIIIPEDEESVTTSIINMTSDSIISLTEISLTVNHSYVGDLIATLTSPSGTVVSLFDRPGVPASNFGCGNNNLNIQFSDFAVNTAMDLEGTCEPGDFAINGQYQPIDMLSTLNGESMSGNWILTLSDVYDDDGGELLEWSISTCSSGLLESAIVINNNELILNNENEKPLSTPQLLVENIESEDVLYTLRSIPQNGNLQKQNSNSGIFENMELGSVFTQFDIDQGAIKYVVINFSENSDQFLFDVVDDQERYAANQVFNISYEFEDISVITEVTSLINCEGESTGEITVNVSGGLAPYTYSIDGENYIDSNVFSNLGAGNYNIIVKDANGIESPPSAVTLADPLGISTTLVFNNNQLTINAVGGTGTFEYSIDGNMFTESNSFLLEDGVEYSLSVRDSNGCIHSEESFVFYIISSVAFTSSSISCNGFEDGSITVIGVEGGLAPYTYTLNGVSNDSGIFDNLPEGNYTIILSDSDGNSFEESFSISEPEVLEILTSVIQDSIFVDGLGGVEPYTYSLDNNNFVDDNFLIGEVGETYTVYIQDANGCISFVDGITILTSVTNPTLDAITLYPNPANNSIQFGSQTVVSIRFSIMDITGRLIRSGVSKSNEMIDINDLSEGLYICRVNADSGEKSFRLVVIE